MKKIITISCILLLSCGSNKQSKQHFKTDLEEYKLKGRVKTFISKTYQVSKKNDEIVKNYETYNRSFEPEKLVFNSKGKLILKITNTPTRKYYYDYNLKGNLINQNVFNYKEKFEYKKVYEYDKKNKLAKVITFKPNERIGSIQTYKYRSKGYKITKIIYEPNKKVSSKEFHKYNLKGNVLKKYARRYRKKRFIATYKYDLIGNLTEVFLNRNKLEFFKIKFKNNSKGNILERQFNGTLFNQTIKEKNSFKYDSYDEKGNWIKSREFENDTIKRIIERSIEYFE